MDKKETNALNQFSARLQGLRLARQIKIVIEKGFTQSYPLTRVRYSPVLVSIRIFSPSPTKVGT